MNAWPNSPSSASKRSTDSTAAPQTCAGTTAVARIVAAPKDLERVGITIPADAPTVKNRVAGAAGTFDIDIAYIPTQIGINETTTIEYQIGAGDIVKDIGNIGNAFLSQFIVTFDFPNATIYLDPISDDGTVAPPTIQGATIGWDGKTAIVSSVAVGICGPWGSSRTPKARARDALGVGVAITARVRGPESHRAVPGPHPWRRAA